ncbi:MAG: phosphoglycerate dehydrogenase [Deltaproteobacteria bacterium]|nr:phosphoglycerate dehydrogenase [Deltaproteobacteria bacterium]MBW2152024.1 phosphoglycerate dehydrogenase [Deltaproteobacteria bacterium]
MKQERKENMEMLNVLIGCAGFALASRRPVDMMKEAGFFVQEPDYKPGELSENVEEFCRIIKGIDALIVSGAEKVPRAVIESADRLKMIAVRGAGYDGVDLAAATERGVLVTRNPGTNTKAVADMAVGLMLAVCRKIAWMDRGMREGRYADLRVLTYDMYEKKLGIIGLGRIGKAVALRAKGFDMKIVYHDLIEYADFARHQGIQKVPMDTLLRESDFVTLHVPLDDSTRNIIGKPQISMMKPGAVLINTARGGLVDEPALYSALVNNHLYGYGADVHEKEPPVFMQLYRLENVVTTPHMAGVSQQALINMSMECAKKVIQFMIREEVPENALNPEVLDNRVG